MADTDVKIDVEDLKNDSFMNHLNSTLLVKRDYQLHEYDYEWLDIIEETLPYLDNILRNPKRFIINEEEVVKVELSKKITVESVIHLTQHTNLIQDYDPKNGDVRPSKVLNINKEESLDTYENRFIFTLINNLRRFFEERVATTGDKSYYIDKKDFKYEGNTKVGTDEINFSIMFNSYDKNEQDNYTSQNKLSYQDRLKQIKVQLDGFTGTELMTTLAKLHVPPVRSPIRKTNVILKNPNFKKAEELWNYLQTFVNKNHNEKDKRDYYDAGALKNEYDQGILMTYVANKVVGDSISNLDDEKVLKDVIDRLIANLLDSDDEITEDQLKEIFLNQLKKAKANNMKKKKVILKIFKEKLEHDNKKIDEDFKSLKEVTI